MRCLAAWNDADSTGLTLTLLSLCSSARFNCGLLEQVQLVGKESLSEDQKVVMDVADIVIEDFLQQNAFSAYDKTCPIFKAIGMLKCIITLYDCSLQALADGPSSSEKKLTWALIKGALKDTIQKVGLVLNGCVSIGIRLTLFPQPSSFSFITLSTPSSSTCR